MEIPFLFNSRNFTGIACLILIQLLFRDSKAKVQINLYNLANSRRQEKRINNLRYVLRSKQDHLLMIS